MKLILEKYKFTRTISLTGILNFKTKHRIKLFGSLTDELRYHIYLDVKTMVMLHIFGSGVKNNDFFIIFNENLWNEIYFNKFFPHFVSCYFFNYKIFLLYNLRTTVNFLFFNS